jgi:hypothetical protein
VKETATRLTLGVKERAILAACVTARSPDPNRVTFVQGVYEWILEASTPDGIEFRIQLVDTLGSNHENPRPPLILTLAKMMEQIAYPPAPAAPPEAPSAIPPKPDGSTSKKGIRRKKKTVG